MGISYISQSFVHGFLWFSMVFSMVFYGFLIIKLQPVLSLPRASTSNLLDSSLRRLGPFLVDVTWAGRAQCLARGDKHGGVLNI